MAHPCLVLFLFALGFGSWANADFIEVHVTSDVYNAAENKEYILGNPIFITGDNCSTIQANLTLNNTDSTVHFWSGPNVEWDGSHIYAKPPQYVDGASAIWISGTVEQVNWALSNVRYNPPTGFVGVEELLVQVEDISPAGACASGTGSTSVIFNTTQTIRIAVYPHNDAPTLSLLGFPSVDQTTRLQIQENQDILLNFALDDVDAGSAQLEVNITVVNGLISLNYSSTLFYADNGPETYSIRGGLNDLRSHVLTALVFHPTPYVHSQFRHPGLGLPQQLGVVTVTVSDFGASPLTPFAPGSSTYTVLMNISSDITTCPCFFMEALNISEGSGPILWPIELRDPEYSEWDQLRTYLTVRMSISNGTLWFPETAARKVYDPIWKAWTFTGTTAAIKRALNQTVLTVDPDFAGTMTLEIYVRDETEQWAHPSRIPVMRNHTTYHYVHVMAVNDAPRIIGREPMYHVNRNRTLVFDEIRAYDPDANPNWDVMNVRIEVTEHGELILANDPEAVGATNISGNWTRVLDNITFDATIYQLNQLITGMQYKNVKPWADYVEHIVDPLHSKDYIKITINDNGFSGWGGPQIGVEILSITAYADLFPTCQDFVDFHRGYCGCYFITYPEDRAINMTDPILSTLPMDFPMKLYQKETQHRAFVQGCCAQHTPAQRPALFTKRYQVGTCTKAEFQSGWPHWAGHQNHNC